MTNPHTYQRTTAALAAALLLTTLLVAAPTAHAAPAVDTPAAAPWSRVVDLLDGWMAALFGATEDGDAGPDMDPDGLAAPSSTSGGTDLGGTTGDAGGDMDPDGLASGGTIEGGGTSGDAGGDMDPNG